MKKDLPSLPKLRKLRLRIEDDIVDNLEIANRPVTGLVYDRLSAYVLSLVEKPGDYRPGIDDIGDGSRIDEEICDEEHKQHRRQAITCVLAPLVGLELTPFRIKNLAIRIAGQFDDIRDGTVPPGGWDSTQPARTLLYIQDVHRLPARGRLYAVELEAHTGPAAGNRWVCKFTGGFLQHLMREIGALKFERYKDPDISGMWLICILWYADGRFQMDEVCVASSQHTYNRKLAKARTAECRGPYRPMRGKPCLPCPVDRKICPVSRYNKAFNITRTCINGHQGLFRNDEDEFCFTCLIKGINLDRNNRKSQ
jgi:hypothetical protein